MKTHFLCVPNVLGVSCATSLGSNSHFYLGSTLSCDGHTLHVFRRMGTKEHFFSTLNITYNTIRRGGVDWIELLIHMCLKKK